MIILFFVSFCRHKKGAIIHNFIVSKIIELKFDAAIFIGAIGDFGFCCLDNIFFPLKNVDDDLSGILLLVSKVEIKDQRHYAVIHIHVELIDCVDGTYAISEMHFWTEDHLFFIFAKDNV